MSLLYWTVLTESFLGEVNGSQAGNRSMTLPVIYFGFNKGS